MVKCVTTAAEKSTVRAEWWYSYHYSWLIVTNHIMNITCSYQMHSTLHIQCVSNSITHHESAFVTVKFGKYYSCKPTRGGLIPIPVLICGANTRGIIKLQIPPADTVPSTITKISLQYQISCKITSKSLCKTYPSTALCLYSN